MVQVDPWEKAADCERSKQSAIDPQRRAIFERLRDLWIALGNKRAAQVGSRGPDSARSFAEGAAEGCPSAPGCGCLPSSTKHWTGRGNSPRHKLGNDRRRGNRRGHP
jgi:hypothetical protein